MARSPGFAHPRLLSTTRNGIVRFSKRLNAQDTSAEPKSDLQLEIAHLLLIDVVGYSKLLVNEQLELIQELNRIVRDTECFQSAEKSGKLIRLPTGDGMALLFFRSPEEPVQCALEISSALQGHPDIQVRMGVHSGPVNQVRDVNDSLNVAGAGINVAQRVMDCGDAGHILLSKHLAEDLAQYRHWRPHLHDLGECEVKHGLRLHLVNLYKDNLGNPRLPEKLKRGRRWKQMSSPVRSVGTPSWPQVALLVLVLLSGVTLAITFSIFFRRPHPMTASVSSEAIVDAVRPIVEKSIAVLPFANLSDEKQNAFLADGVQDEILNNLAKVADLKVISRTSVMQYKSGVIRNLREVAKELGVAHVVEGSVQRAGGRVRVSAQLIDARSDTHLWADHYDRDLADVFAIESELAEKIVSQLKSKLSPEEKAAIEEPPTSNVRAYEPYVRAKALMDDTTYANAKEKLNEAVRLLTSAVELDPNFLNAYCWLAAAHDQIYFAGVDHSPARLALADDALEKANRLKPNSGEVHLARARHFYFGFLDFKRARAELSAAEHLLPNESRVFELLAFIDRREGRWDDSLKYFARALELDPRNAYLLQQLSLSYHYLRRYTEEVATIDRVITLAPNDSGARLQRANLELAWHANPRPMHDIFPAMLKKDPIAAAGFADDYLHVALCDRNFDEADRALNLIGPDGAHAESFAFPRAWYEALIARAHGDAAAAQSAFTRARAATEKLLRDQGEYAETLCVLGLIDAGLGRKDDAVREGRHAVDLLPVSKDSINGASLVNYLAVIYVWVGEKDQALTQLETAAKLPGTLNYGQLRLHPYWDQLRGDPRFEKIVASLAPK
jgi:TolB-like protein/class 3 adenylate cyclase/Flp pilus assembly protein TadD